MKTTFLFIIKLSFAIALLLIANIAFTQFWGQGAPPPPTQAPIDGGVSLLIAGMVGYGVKKAREYSKQ